jgi:hypothetical protein
MANPVAHSLEFSDPPAIEASCSLSLLFNATWEKMRGALELAIQIPQR